MNLANARNIHLAPAVGPVPSPGDPAAPAPLRLRQVPRSPVQEYQARSAAVGGTEALPDALAAILLYETRTIQVTQKGKIEFDLQGTTYKFFHPDCRSCHPSNAGKPVRFVFDRDLLDCIFVLDAHGAYVETVPRDGKHDWFSPQAGAEIAKYKRTATHVAEHLQRIHAPDTKRELERVKSNAEKLQYLNTFPVPQATPTRGDKPEADGIIPADRTSSPAEAPSRFGSAEQIIAAAQQARRQKDLARENAEEIEDLAALARKARMADYKAPQNNQPTEDVAD